MGYIGLVNWDLAERRGNLENLGDWLSGRLLSIFGDFRFFRFLFGQLQSQLSVHKLQIAVFLFLQLHLFVQVVQTIVVLS